MVTPRLQGLCLVRQAAQVITATRPCLSGGRLTGRRAGPGRVADSEVQMLSVVDGFVQQHRDVVVEQGVCHGAAGSLPGDQAEVAQHSELVGDR